MKKKIIITVVIVLLISTVFIIRKRNGNTVIVRKVDIERVVVRKTISASGKVTSVNESDLALPAIGQLQYISIEKGDEVKKGQIIGNLYNYDSSQDSQAAKDNRDVTKHDLSIYIENYKTNPNAVGGIDEYELNIKRLKELLSKSEASYQSSLGSLSKTILSAPFDGTIIDVYVDVGEVIVAGLPIVKIADLSELIFEISVDQEDFGLLKIGQKVEITLDSYNDALFSATVLEIPQYANEETEEFAIKLKFIKSEELPILLGMKGDASIIISSSENEIEALIFDVIYQKGSDIFVWVDENGTLVKVNIKIGLEGDVYTEVQTDLSGKSIVVPATEGEIEENAKVKYED